MEENLCFYVSMSRNFHNGKYVVWQVSNSASSRSRIFPEGWDSDLACVCRKKAKIRADFFRTALFCAALLRWEAEMAEMAFRGRDYGRDRVSDICDSGAGWRSNPIADRSKPMVNLGVQNQVLGPVLPVAVSERGFEHCLFFASAANRKRQVQRHEAEPV